MDKKYFLTVAIVFVAWMVGSFLVHGLWLGTAYESLGAIYRSAAEQEATFPFMLIAHVLLAGGFVWIYQRGCEDKPWLAQGVRFGIIIALFATVSTFLIYYAVQPLPMSLVVRQIVGDSAVVIVVGAITAFMYQRKT